MRLETSRFGTIEVEADAIVTFTQPIIGFNEYRRFAIVPGPEGSIVTWLQSVDNGELAFLLMNPVGVVPDYVVQVGPSDLAELAAGSMNDLDLYTLLVVPQDQTQVRTNLKAPILINQKQRLGKQVVLERSDYPIQYFLGQARQPSEKSKEATHARSDA